MKTSLNLSIPKPCSEKWENFVPTSDGGFCGACSKNVIDFTKMSDGQILDFLKHKPAHSCGRFRADQLKIYSEAMPARIGKQFAILKAGFLSILFIISSKSGFSQTTNSKVAIEIAQYPGQSFEKDSASFRQIVTGVVKSEDDDLPLPGVNVLLKGTSIGTVTDFEGRFEFPEKLEDGDILIFSFIGMESKEYRVKKRNALEIQLGIDMKMESCVLGMLGEVSVDEVYSEKNGFQKLWSWIKELF